jgi:hypothetical protein
VACSVVGRQRSSRTQVRFLKTLLHQSLKPALSGLDAGIKMRPTPQDLKELGPAFEHRWKTYFENAPDKPVIWVGAVSWYAFELYS